MSAPINHFTLYLSKEGDSVRIENFNENGSTLPEQAEALACRTHQEVLTFLERLNRSATKNELNFYHQHNPSYDAHLGTYPKGKAHPCSLQTQIEFVRLKIAEMAHGGRHEPLNAKSFCVLL